MQKDITSYPDINEFLRELLNELKKELGEKLVGVYLFGSLVWGDFDYDSSDIDVLVATSSDINQQTFDQLDVMQKKLAKKYKHAGEGKIEIVYASVHALQTFKTEKSQIAVISPGEPFHFKNAGIDWLLNWYMIQEKSRVLFGPLSKEIIAHTTKGEFIEAVNEHAMMWQNWTNDLKDRPSQAYAILTLCRAYYTYKNGEQTSKKKAAEWTAKEFPQRAPLIANALKWREDWRNKNVNPEDTLSETKSFVHFIIEKIIKTSFSPTQNQTELFLPIIHKQYPDITHERITFLDDGWDHYVFVIDNKTAFRFPRTKENGQKDEVETKFLESFVNQSPVRVQNMKLYTDKETGIRYQKYDFIPGVRFTKEFAQTLSHEKISQIAKSIGEFLTVLHAFPIEKAKELDMDGIISPLDYVDYWEDFLKKKIQLTMFHYFSSGEQEWIEKIFNEYMTTVRKHPFSVKVTHFDLLPEHILIDPHEHTLSGIIDFSLRISDPAYDFSYFDRYGENFLNTVIANYPPHLTDKTFFIRRKFYVARLGFSFLSQAMERDKEKVPFITQQIHHYIEEHK